MSDWLSRFCRTFSKRLWSHQSEVLIQHSTDAWMASASPEIVIFPETTQDVSKILRFAHANRVPVTARGAGKGYVGGCVPKQGGIVLSLIRMNRILEIHPEDGVAVVQPGIITGKLQEAARKKGLFYPPDPASLKDCFIGGNIATNAGGPRCLKYGVTRHYVLGLQVVMADGMIVRVGGRTIKNKTGFDLIGMFVGSEGLLGVVTEATLRLIPHPPQRAALSVSFQDPRQAARAVQKILGAGILPAAMEVADDLTLQAARNALGIGKLIPGKAFLLVEIDGSESAVRSGLRELEAVVRTEKPLALRKAVGDVGCEKLWQVRREFSASLKATGLKKLNEDIVVPRSRLVDLFALSGRIQKKYGISVASFGHAGDGNIHVNLMLDVKDPAQVRKADRALNELFTQVLKWGGSITGEHGIGLAKMPWWKQATSPEVRKLHSIVKKALDPKGILNPGKFV